MKFSIKITGFCTILHYFLLARYILFHTLDTVIYHYINSRAVQNCTFEPRDTCMPSSASQTLTLWLNLQLLNFLSRNTPNIL